MSTIATPPAPAGTTTPSPASPPAWPRAWRWTVAQYHELGRQGFFDDKRVELIRGEVVEMSPISLAHATAVGAVSDALTPVFAVGFFVNGQQPFSVPGAARGSEPQPDVAVIPGARKAATAHPTRAALLVEVADATLFYDTATKAELYATAGVTDYWALDLEHRQLIVFRDPHPLPNGSGATAYRSCQTFGPADTVSPLAAPGAAVRVADLLP